MTNEIYAGVFRGRKLVQTSGEIGGARSVFVKVKGIKNELVYPTFGGKIMNAPKGTGFKFYAGDLFEFRTNADGVRPEVYLLKTYLVESVSGSVVNIVNDGYKHKPFVGDKLGVAPEEIGGEMTAATITKVENAKVGDGYQFMRLGYFCADKDSTKDKLIFNRSVSLKDGFKAK